MAQIQALAFEGPWQREDYLQVAGADRQSEVDDTLATLVKHSIVVDQGGTYTLSHLGLRAWLLSGLSERETETYHLSLAELCERSGRPAIMEVHHQLLAGCAERALDRLLPLLSGPVASRSAHRCQR